MSLIFFKENAIEKYCKENNCRQLIKLMPRIKLTKQKQTEGVTVNILVPAVAAIATNAYSYSSHLLSA